MAHDHVYLICENKCLVEGYSKGQIDEKMQGVIPIELAEFITVPQQKSTSVISGTTPIQKESITVYETRGAIAILEGVTNKQISDLVLQQTTQFDTVNYNPTTGIISFVVYAFLPNTPINVKVTYKINGLQYIQSQHD